MVGGLWQLLEACTQALRESSNIRIRICLLMGAPTSWRCGLGMYSCETALKQWLDWITKMRGWWSSKKLGGNRYSLVIQSRSKINRHFFGFWFCKLFFSNSHDWAAPTIVQFRRAFCFGWVLAEISSSVLRLRLRLRCDIWYTQWDGNGKVMWSTL